ncbi:helix-turn-helix domain-containing protein [Marinifilum sp. RC60d5]|uniref:helix-turn-helix domain-containing protein n=1 Tax=Marinifilum sp. RC60d5 TaxID=3458414 RepID=UPI00403708CC
MLTDFRLPESDISLEGNFSLGFYSTKFPIKDSPERLQWGMTCICTSGYIDLEIDFITYRLEKGVILTAFPMQVVEQKQLSEDFSLIYITYSKEILQNVLFRFSSGFEVFLKENPVFNAPEEIYTSDIEFLKLIKNKYEEINNICRNEIIISLVRVFYLNIYNGIYQKLLNDSIKLTRQMEIFRLFLDLITQYYNKSREVAFYAKKLNITPKYLSIVTQGVRGQNAKKVIDDYIMTEIKLQLNSSSKSILEISEELNFPDQSFFCKFFKRHSGLSPKQFRDK